MRCARWIFLVLAICLLTVSCGEQTGKPASSSRQYQVLVVGDKAGVVSKELSDTVEGLPQPEPAFDVSQSGDTTLSDFQKLSRSIVIVDIDGKVKKPQISYKRNVYASPQIIITVTAPSEASLASYARDGHVRKLLEAFELSASIKALQRQNNPKAQQKIKSMFGISMLVPPNMTASRKGKDFLWLSNNTNEGLENICVYRVGKTNADFRSVRDSVMRKNILGEQNDMYMQTGVFWLAKDYVLPPKTRSFGGQNTVFHFYRGLWYMKGDAMGGPFEVLELQQKRYNIYLEAFVYAPESKKRNKMKHLEASLMTVGR